jgi:hypothetical protein
VLRNVTENVTANFKIPITTNATLSITQNYTKQLNLTSNHTRLGNTTAKNQFTTSMVSDENGNANEKSGAWAFSCVWMWSVVGLSWIVLCGL